MNNDIDADIEILREKFLNFDFDEKQFQIDADKTILYAQLCGETSPRFLDKQHADFQAPPTYVGSLTGRRSLPKDFPSFGIGMDAGKSVECFQIIKPGNTVIGKTHLHDVYTKTGRSGRMVFVVSRIEFFDESGTHLANADNRVVMKEKS